MTEEQDPRDAVIAQLSVTNEQLRRELTRQVALAGDITHYLDQIAKKVKDFGHYYPMG